MGEIYEWCIYSVLLLGLHVFIQLLTIFRGMVQILSKVSQNDGLQVLVQRAMHGLEITKG